MGVFEGEEGPARQPRQHTEGFRRFPVISKRPTIIKVNTFRYRKVNVVIYLFAVNVSITTELLALPLF